MDKKIHGDNLDLQRQYLTLYVDDHALKKLNQLNFFRHFQRRDVSLQIALISKLFESQERDWSQMIDLSK